MTAHVVVCSLGVSNYEYTLEIQNGNLEPTMDQPDGPSQAWSLWTPLTNDMGTQLNQMVRMVLCIVDIAETIMRIGVYSNCLDSIVSFLRRREQH